MSMPGYSVHSRIYCSKCLMKGSDTTPLLWDAASSAISAASFACHANGILASSHCRQNQFRADWSAMYLLTPIESKVNFGLFGSGGGGAFIFGLSFTFC